MHPIRRLLMLALALALSVLPLRAQELADYDYENLTFRGVGFDYGYIWPSKVEPTHMFSLRLDLGFLGPAVRIVPGIAYWSSHFRASELDRLADRLSRLPPLVEQGVVIRGADLGRVEWSDLVLSLDAHIVWTAPLDIITFVGLGASLHALNGRGDAIVDTFVEDLLDSTTAGVSIMGGAETMITPRLRLYSEARYTLASNVRYPGIRFGAALMLPTRSANPGAEAGQ